MKTICPSQRRMICASCLYFSRMRIPNGYVLIAQARRLSFYSVSTRYPGDSATREDMEQALVDMGAVRDLVRASFGLQ